MLEDFLKLNIIDQEGLLLLNYHHLHLDENETMILLLVMRLEKMRVPYITPKELSQYMRLDDKKIDHYVVSLLTRQFLSLDGNSLSTKPLLPLLIGLYQKTEQKPAQEAESVNLVELFEHEFARALTPIEIETLKEWKQCHYSDQMIVAALKEATLSHVHNMRYIEKILIDWAKHGMKQSGREKVDVSVPETVKIVDYPWWEEE